MAKLLSVLSLVVILALAQSGLAPTEAFSIPQGACCYPDGTCMDDMFEAECAAQGGLYMGHGTICAEVVCVAQPQGACCYPDGTCMDAMFEAECAAQGGLYMGDGTICAEVVCVPQPQGACCYPDGSCSDGLTQAECQGQGGKYMGDGTNCAQVDCTAAIPTLTEWGLIIFGVVLLGFITWVFLKRRKATDVRI